MNKLFINELELKDKKVFVRVDYNVPFDEQGNITDDARIRATLPTVNYLLDELFAGHSEDAEDPKTETNDQTSVSTVVDQKQPKTDSDSLDRASTETIARQFAEQLGVDWETLDES